MARLTPKEGHKFHTWSTVCCGLYEGETMLFFFIASKDKMMIKWLLTKDTSRERSQAHDGPLRFVIQKYMAVIKLTVPSLATIKRFYSSHVIGGPATNSPMRVAASSTSQLSALSSDLSSRRGSPPLTCSRAGDGTRAARAFGRTRTPVRRTRTSALMRCLSRRGPCLPFVFYARSGLRLMFYSGCGCQ